MMVAAAFAREIVTVRLGMVIVAPGRVRIPNRRWALGGWGVWLASAVGVLVVGAAWWRFGPWGRGWADLRQRARARRRLAAEQGWEYVDERPELLRRWRQAIVESNDGSRARFVVTGTLDGHRVTVFDAVTPQPKSPWDFRLAPHTLRTVHLAELPDRLPLVVVSRHSLAVDTMVPLLKQAALRRGHRLYETGDAAYDAVHVVETTDLNLAERLLTLGVREFTDDRPWLEWRVDGDQLCYVGPYGPALFREDRQPLPELRSLVRLVAELDPRLWGEAQDAGPGTPAGGRATTREHRPTTMYRGGPAHTGVFPEGTPPAGFRPWRVRLSSGLGSAPAVCDGTLYQGSLSGHCFALNAATGEERWRFAAGAKVDGTPAVGDGVVYFTTEDGLLHAVGTDDGRERWQRRVGQSAPLALDDGVLYVVHVPRDVMRGASSLRALDAQTGEPRWEVRLPDGSASGPAVADGRVYVQGAKAELSAFRVRDGKRLWHNDAGERYMATGAPTVADGTVYIGTGSGRLDAFDARTGEHRWGAQASGTIDKSPAVLGDTVYIGDSAGGVYAVDAVEGRQRWQLPSPHGGSAVTLSGSSAWVVSGVGNRTLLRLDPAGGAVRWRVPLDSPGSDPVVADGVVHVVTMKGSVLAVDAMTGQSQSKWRSARRI